MYIVLHSISKFAVAVELCELILFVFMTIYCCRFWTTAQMTSLFYKRREFPVKITTIAGMPRLPSGSHLNPENTSVFLQP